MKIQDIPVDKLRAAAYNPRHISKHDFESLQRSIDSFGFVEPVVVNKRTNTIVGGHQRLNAARALKLETVPVVYVDLDGENEQVLNIALNKIHGEFDNDALAEILDGLDDALAGLTGHTEEEINGLQDGWVEHTEDGPKDTARRSWTLKELREERDRFCEALGRGDNGFVEWLADQL